MSDPTTDQPIPNDNNELHSDGVDALSENYIFTALRSTNSSLNTIVSEVIDSFQDQNQALNDLCCLILLASGCNSSINTEAFQDVDLIPDALGLVEKEFKTIKLVKCKGYSEFWVKLVIKMKNKYLFEGDLLDIIVQWIASISSSGVRVLRHNGTIAALGVITGLATLLQSNIDSTLKLQSKKVKEAVDLKKELSKEKQVLESFVSKLFNGVFVHRFRDVCNLVRGDCIKEMGVWMLKCPSLFLESSYLRYFGWMLSDSSTNVRLQCLKSLNNLVKPAHFSNLRPFFERFKQRILQIAGCEREASVRVCGVRLVGSMANMAMFDDEEMETVLVLVLDQDERVRTAIAPTIVDYYNERCQGVEVQDLPRIKTFLQLAIQISKTAYQTQKQTELETKQSFNDPNLSKIVLQNPSANSIRMENSSQIIWGWLAKEARDEDETVGSNNMIALVTAVYEDLSILSKVEIMADYLLEEDALTTEEEHCLVYIMTASISIANQNKKKKAYTEMQNCIVNSYVPLLAKYSKEFNGPTMGLLKELVITLGSASADWYQGRKVGSSMEDVVSALLELYKRNCNSPLLKEIANTIVNFTTQNPALEATITAYLNSTSEFLSNLLQDMDGKSRPSSEDIDKCCSAVSKLYHFSTVYDISDHSWKTGDTVLEFFLVCLANDQSDVRLAVLLQQNIEIMARDVLRRANQAYKQDSQIKLDTDDENSFIQEYQKILKFCEAVVCDNVTKANISFNHLHKLHCTNILVDLSRFCNGPIHTKFPQLKYDFGPELAMLCAENLEQVVYICAFMLDESLTKISEQVMLEFGIEIQRLFSGLTVLSKQNIAPYKHLGRFLCYYGLDYQVEDYYAKTDSSKSFEMFGKVWDDLCTGSIESLMRSFLQNVDHVYKSDLNAYEKLIRVEDRAKDLATCIQSALGGVIYQLT